MKKPILELLMFLVTFGVGYSNNIINQAYEGGEKVICTYRGIGVDPVYEIRCRVGNSTKIEIPGELKRTIIDSKEDWLLAEGKGMVIVQPVKVKSNTYLSIIIKFNERQLNLCFKLIEVSGKNSGSEYDEQVQIIVEEL